MIVLIDTGFEKHVGPVDIAVLILGNRRGYVGIFLQLLHQILILLGIEGVDLFPQPGDTGIGTEFDLRFAYLAPLGGNQYDTVGGPGSVNGSRRSIFQYLHALDVARVQTRYIVAGHTVDNIQWFVRSLYRCSATHTNAHARTGSTRRLHYLNTGRFTLESLCCVDNGALVNIGSRYDRYGRGNIFPFHRTVTNHHHFVEQLVVFAHRYGIDIFAADSQRVGVIADVRKGQEAALGGLEFPVSVYIGHGSTRTVVDGNRNPNQGVTLRVDNLSAYRLV